MDRNLSTGSMMPGAPYGVIDLQGPMHSHQQQHPQTSLHHHHQQQQQQPHHYNHSGLMGQPPVHDVFPMSAGQVHERNQHTSPPVMDYNKGDRMKPSTSEEEDAYHEEGADGHHEMGKGKKVSPWQRVKWTDAMVKLLITAVSYIGEDSTSECNRGGRRKFSILQKKGKWKSVSKVMAERGCYVSPQQCEDKFNDLNKRYKRLNDVLGRGTSCQVVENPALLDRMDHLSEKAKEDVRKILSSKHLFYEEMCSYHNGNRLHLPADPALQRSLQLALQSKDEHDNRRTSQDGIDEEDHGADTDDMEDECEENHTLHDDMGGSCFPKRLRQMRELEDSGGHPFNSLDCNSRPHLQGISVDMNVAFPEGSEADLQKQWVMSRKFQLEEQSLHIQAQMLELERQRFKWQRFSKKKDRELDKMRMENERMKLENERLALELKRRELDVGLH